METAIATLLIMASGFALILQNRGLAGTLFISAIAMIVVVPMFGALAPGAVLVVVIIGGAMLAVALLRVLMRASVGRRAADDAMGYLAADAVRFLFLLPFRMIGGFFQLIFGGERMPRPAPPANYPRRRRRYR